MPRYLPRRRSRRTSSEAAFENALESQQREMLRLLQRESQKLLKEWERSFAKSLEEEFAKSIRTQPIIAPSRTSPAPSNTGGISDAFSSLDLGVLTPSFDGVTNFLGRAISIFARRPRTSRHEAETSRSLQTQQAFRTSRSQELADANSMLSAGERNL